MATAKKPLGHKKPAPKAGPSSKAEPKADKAPASKAEADKVPPNTVPFEIDPKQVEASLKKLRDKLTTLAKKGRYTKVRFKFRGKQLLPDIPLAAVVAVEGITFYWTGLLRALIFNFAGQTVLDVELVNDSEKELAQGKERILAGDVDEALAHFRTAQDMDEENPVVHLNVGIALRLKGETAQALAALERALALDPNGAAGTVGGEAQRLIEKLKG